METRLKIGEALMKVARRCGELLPKYIDLLLPGIMQVCLCTPIVLPHPPLPILLFLPTHYLSPQGTKDADAHFRASCLSNLGEFRPWHLSTAHLTNFSIPSLHSGTLALLLRFSLHTNLQEILNCVRAVALHDPAPEVCFLHNQRPLVHTSTSSFYIPDTTTFKSL